MGMEISLEEAAVYLDVIKKMEDREDEQLQPTHDP